jgi:hypothetical protein
MRYKIAILIIVLFLCNIGETFSKGGGKGGSFPGGIGSSHRGAKYFNPPTGNKYTPRGLGGGVSPGNSGNNSGNSQSGYPRSGIEKQFTMAEHNKQEIERKRKEQLDKYVEKQNNDNREREIAQKRQSEIYVKSQNHGNILKNDHLRYAKINYYNLKRDIDGKIIRSETAKNDYLKSIGYKNIPPGYQIDHIKPLYAGGCDCPSNMQLIQTEVHKAKTKNDYKEYGR